jgi:pimeloyl-ACP methyl ester carboxylesterase
MNHLIRIVISVLLNLLYLNFAFSGELKRASYLGARLRPNPESQIVEVRSVEDGSAASKAGLRKGDRIIRINGKPIPDRFVFEEVYGSLRAGDAVSFEVRRDGTNLTTSVVLPSLHYEKWEGIETRYDEVITAQGNRQRIIVTRPERHSGRIPGIMLVNWLSCDSVEFPFGPQDGFAKLLHALGTKSGFAMMRVEKPGTGDSGGPPCHSLDFQTELEGYQAALHAFKKYEFVDPDKIILLGMSNGGGVVPLVAAQEKVAGYVISGGWSKTWFEHMIELERNRLALSGQSPGEISEKMKGYAEFYTRYLIEKRSPEEVVRKYPALAGLWYDEPEHQYGRPAAFYHQLQELNLAAAWEKVDVPVLVIYGEYDWIMSRFDHESIAEIVNHNRPGHARFVAIPKMDHGFTIQENMQGSFNNFGGGRFDESLVTLILNWLGTTSKK